MIIYVQLIGAENKVVPSALKNFKSARSGFNYINLNHCASPVITWLRMRSWSLLSGPSLGIVTNCFTFLLGKMKDYYWLFFFFFLFLKRNNYFIKTDYSVSNIILFDVYEKGFSCRNLKNWGNYGPYPCFYLMIQKQRKWTLYYKFLWRNILPFLFPWRE